ncbi:MAG TPA: hypothetical protein VKC64_07305 [Burkholderiales bacterium]|nr:hypothetical protein [Burkholderiales bacterium]
MSTTADPNGNAPAARGRFGKRGGEPQERDDYRVVVRWIPLVVPLFAVLIAILVALIEWGVL